jgi:hypothetical protein
MLGRRLLLLAALLLASGAVAAALAPREGGESTTTTTATRPSIATPPPASGGTAPRRSREVTRSVSAAAPEPAVVRARAGDLLNLTVAAPSADEVELVGLGRFQAVDEFSPARFNFFLSRVGTFPIRLRERDRDIGRIVVNQG